MSAPVVDKGGEVKPTKDYSAEVATAVPTLTKDIKSNPSSLPAALSSLLALEKKTRLGADSKSTVILSTAILQACVDAGDWKALNDHISILSKRRAQLQKVLESVVQVGATFVDKTPNKEVKRELIEALRTVSAGKIFVELERARLTRTLAAMEEAEGKTISAAEILQEVQVETIGTMEAREKVEFLLEQIRLCLAKKDYVRTEIIAKKVDTKTLAEDEKLADLKVRHYRQMIELHAHHGQYFNICKAWSEIYHTPSVQSNPAEWKPALTKLAIFSLLAPFDSEVSDILARLTTDKKLRQLPGLQSLLQNYRNDEVMAWPLSNEAELKADSTFLASADEAAAAAPVKMDDITDEAARTGGGSADQRWKDLHKRIIQHQITSKRLAHLLKLDEATSESFLSEMVTSGQLYARLDRPAGIITFKRTQSGSDVVNGWAADISALLGIVESTCHAINKENMLHGIKA